MDALDHARDKPSTTGAHEIIATRSNWSAHKALPPALPTRDVYEVPLLQKQLEAATRAAEQATHAASAASQKAAASGLRAESLARDVQALQQGLQAAEAAIKSLVEANIRLAAQLVPSKMPAQAPVAHRDIVAAPLETPNAVSRFDVPVDEVCRRRDVHIASRAKAMCLADCPAAPPSAATAAADPPRDSLPVWTRLGRAAAAAAGCEAGWSPGAQAPLRLPGDARASRWLCLGSTSARGGGGRAGEEGGWLALHPAMPTPTLERSAGRQRTRLPRRSPAQRPADLVRAEALDAVMAHVARFQC